MRKKARTKKLILFAVVVGVISAGTGLITSHHGNTSRWAQPNALRTIGGNWSDIR